MSLEHLFSLGTALLATFGLVFVGVEIRDTRRFMRADLVDRLAQEFNDLHDDTSFILADASARNEDERQKAIDLYPPPSNATILRIANSFEKMALQVRLGALSIDEVESLFGVRIVSFARSPYVQSVLAEGPLRTGRFELLDWLLGELEKRGLKAKAARDLSQRGQAPAAAQGNPEVG